VEAVEGSRQSAATPVVLTSPQGEPLSERLVLDLVEAAQAAGELLLVCGHYKGVDERVREALVTRTISIGDYVLTGGELAAAVVVDAVVRLVPGVLNDSESALSDSYQDGLLGAPEYTRPPEYRGMKVPDVLLSGNHMDIEQWRQDQRLHRTQTRRSDLIK
jgi:tRNA (guanine37-N1)-methyltransferase